MKRTVETSTRGTWHAPEIPLCELQPERYRLTVCSGVMFNAGGMYTYTYSYICMYIYTYTRIYTDIYFRADAPQAARDPTNREGKGN